jgi:hypothetical protein
MFEWLPIWVLFICLFLVVWIAMQVGYLIRTKFAKSKTENEGLVSVTTGAVLGLLGFVLAFTFSIVYGRFEVRKELVRQEANAIRRAWLRSDFMDNSSRSRTQDLLKKYLDVRLLAVKADNAAEIAKLVDQSEAIQNDLWDTAVAKAKANALAGLNAPYLQSVNDMIDFHHQRLAIGVEDRIPKGIWLALGALLLICMTSMGYFAAMKGVRYSSSNIILAICFSLLFVVVSALDNPFHGLFEASQRPLMGLKLMMSK